MFSYLIDHTFKGLTSEFYFGNLRQTCIIPIIFLSVPWAGAFLEYGTDLRFEHIHINLILWTIYFFGSWLLYPYSRFAYFSILDSIPPLKFIESLVTMLTLRLFTLVSILFCYAVAFVFAPIGLLFIFVQTRRLDKQHLQEQQTQEFVSTMQSSIPPLPTVQEELAKWSALYREGKVSKEEYFKIVDSFKDLKGK